MAAVEVAPMPLGYRDIPAKLRPCHPPIFDGEPSDADRQLALALLLELDDESRSWYLGGRSEFVGLPVPAEYL
jgi:hypothetical protein